MSAVHIYMLLQHRANGGDVAILDGVDETDTACGRNCTASHEQQCHRSFATLESHSCLPKFTIAVFRRFSPCCRRKTRDEFPFGPATRDADSPSVLDCGT